MNPVFLWDSFTLRPREKQEREKTEREKDMHAKSPSSRGPWQLAWPTMPSGPLGLENKTLRAIQGPLVHSRPSSWSVQWASCGLYNVQIDPSGLWMKSSMTYTIWYLGLMGFSCLSLKMPEVFGESTLVLHYFLPLYFSLNFSVMWHRVPALQVTLTSLASFKGLILFYT